MALTKEQLADRATGLGGSDAAAALGLSNFKSPVQLYLEKTGEAEPEDIGDIERIKWGNRLEDAIAQGWSEDTGIKVARVNHALRHPDHPWMLAHLDRRQVGRARVLECKNVNQFYARAAFGPSGTDEVPDPYLVQVHHQITIVNAKWGWEGGDLAALIGGNELRSYNFSFDPEFSAMLIRRLGEFWQRVVDRNPPPATSLMDLDALYATDNGMIKEIVDPAIVDVYEKLQDLKQSEKTLTAEKVELELKLKLAIAEAAGVKVDDDVAEMIGVAYAGKTLATWKSQSRTSVDTARLKSEAPDVFEQYKKTSSFRVLRLY